MFSVSACPKCGNGLFKLVEIEPVGSRVKMNFVQCSSCNTPVGVTEYYTNGAAIDRVDKLAGEVQALSSEVGSVRSLMHEVLRLLRNR